jgi:hypothetical protein
MTNFFLFCRGFKASITTPTASYDRFRLQVTSVFAAPAAAAALMAVVFLLSVDFCGAVSLSESAARVSVSHGAAGVNVTAARSVNAPRAVTTTLSVSDAEKLHNRYGTAVGSVTRVIAAAKLDVVLGFMRFFSLLFMSTNVKSSRTKYLLRLKGEKMTASLWDACSKFLLQLHQIA